MLKSETDSERIHLAFCLTEAKVWLLKEDLTCGSMLWKAILFNIPGV